MMWNRIELTALWLASNRLGVTWIPINTEVRFITLRGVVQAADPKVVAVDSEPWTELRPLNIIGLDSVYVNGDTAYEPDVRELSTFLGSSFTVATQADVTPDTTATFSYTSGTTGKSRPCTLSHEIFLIQAEAIVESFGLRCDDVLYCPFPLFHIDATTLTVVPAVISGAMAALSV